MKSFNLSIKNFKIAVGSKKHRKQLFDNINYDFEPKKIYFILGKSGIGKTTLIHHFNGLKIADSGFVKICNNIYIYSNKWKKIKNIREIRKKIQLLFDYSENQLFKSTIIDDVMFGPNILRIDKNKSYKLAKYYLNKFDIDDKLFFSSPFLLSKGQKRKVALAGILSINPDIMVFDEPTIDLDYKTKEKFWNLIIDLKNQNKTIIIINHNTDEILEYGDDVLVLNNRAIYAKGSPWKIFNNKKLINDLNLTEPFVIKILNALPKKFNCLNKIKINNVSQLAHLLNKKEEDYA